MVCKIETSFTEEVGGGSIHTTGQMDRILQHNILVASLNLNFEMSNLIEEFWGKASEVLS